MRLGLRERPLRVEAVARRRLFPALVQLPEEWMRYYRRLVPTAEISNPRRHALKLAF